MSLFFIIKKHDEPKDDSKSDNENLINIIELNTSLNHVNKITTSFLLLTFHMIFRA